MVSDPYEEAWIETWKLILGLWPGWNATEEREALWRSQLERRNPDAIRKAIMSLASEDASDWPKLPKLLAKLSPADSTVRQRRRYSHVQEELALDAQCEQDNAEILVELSSWDDDRLAAACEHAFTRCGAFIATATDGPPESWPKVTRGLVWAADNDLRLLREGT